MLVKIELLNTLIIK